MIISRYLSKIILFQDDYERFILELNVKGLKNCLRKSIAKKVMLANCGLRYRLRFMVKKNNVGAHVFHVRLEK
ncbi:MAG: hypothetical protein C0601_10940 [Candidatus Muiribacterium halophilum]|uniref:Uncharacterized protein n=1 Tax=Muiribacterium halophilum TaxID=2053465 RepID=A0A2N5ZBS6_MUIH1|nr:MAG: hypothetical protein C0601_10940 [Candidatus Muirbacterium halophilum]